MADAGGRGGEIWSPALGVGWPLSQAWLPKTRQVPHEGSVFPLPIAKWPKDNSFLLSKEFNPKEAQCQGGHQAEAPDSISTPQTWGRLRPLWGSFLFPRKQELCELPALWGCFKMALNQLCSRKAVPWGTLTPPAPRAHSLARPPAPLSSAPCREREPPAIPPSAPHRPHPDPTQQLAADPPRPRRGHRLLPLPGQQRRGHRHQQVHVPHC